MYSDYMFDMDSFGQDCPTNWQEIADALNGFLDELAEDCTDKRDLRDEADALWAQYWSFGIYGVPSPVWEEE